MTTAKPHNLRVSNKLRLVGLTAGKVTERFILRLVEEFIGIIEHKWKSEHPLVFLVVILRQEPDVQKHCDIRKSMAKRLDEWEADRYATLVRNVEERGKMSTTEREREREREIQR